MKIVEITDTETVEVEKQTIKIAMIKVSVSSNVTGYGYDEGSETILVRFKSGSLYAYFRRAPSVWRDLRMANSKQQFVTYSLTPQGNYRKLK